MDLPETIDAGDLVLKRWDRAFGEAAGKGVRDSLPQLKPFMPWAHDGYDVADSRSFIELSAKEWAEGPAFNYAVFTTAGELVGSCGLMTRMGAGTLEIGYWIHSGQTGRGYASAAVNAVTRVGLALPGVEGVVIRHDVANPASG